MRKTMKKFRVTICYEEGFVVEVQAASEQDAEQKVLDMVGENRNDLDCKVVHRDFFVNDVDEA